MNIWGWWACLGPTRMKFVATNATVTDDQPATEKIQPRNHGNCSRLVGLWTQSCCAASVFEDELIHLYMCLGVDCCAGTTCRRSLTSLTIWNLKKGQICYSSQFMIFPSGNRLIFFIFFHCDSDRAWMCFWCMLPRDKRIDSSNLKRIVAISVWLFTIVDVKVVGLLLLYTALTHGSDSDIWKAQVLGDNISDAVLPPLLVLCCIPWWHVRSNTVQRINWTPYMEHDRCFFGLVA